LHYLQEHYEIFRLYVVGFRAVGQALMLGRYLLANPDADTTFRREAQEKFERSMADLLALATEFDAFAAATEHNYPVYVLLSSERLRALHKDLRKSISLDAAVALNAAS